MQSGQLDESTNCTALDLEVRRSLLHSHTLVRECIVGLAAGFRQGIDGHVTAVQSVFLRACESDDTHSMYDYGVCCPGELLVLRWFPPNRPNLG